MLFSFRKLAAVLALLLCTVLTAAAESIPSDCVYRVTADQLTGEVTVGTAFCTEPNELLCPIGVVSGASGLHVYDLRGQEVSIGSIHVIGDLLLTLELTDETGLTPWPEDVASPVPGPVTAVTATQSGMAISAAEIGRKVTYGALDYHLVTCEQPLLPGAILLNADNALTAIVTGRWTERDDTYVALSLEELPKLAGDTADLQNERGEWTDAYTASAKPATLSVVLDESIWENNHSCVVFASRSGEPTYFYVVIESKPEQFEIPFPVVPGETYSVCVWRSEDGSTPRSFSNAQSTDVTIPLDEGPFTQYDYTETMRYFGTLPADADPYGTDLAAEVPVTRELLAQTEQKLYLQVCSRYTVTERSTCALTVALESPEGWLFTEQGSFIFDAEYADSDCWHSDISDLLELYVSYSKELAAGTYTVSYYFDNTLVGTLSFTLE